MLTRQSIFIIRDPSSVIFYLAATAAMISFVMLIHSLTQSVNAFEMSNDLYRIQGGNFNSISGRATSPTKKLTFTSGENLPGVFTGENYTVKSGFEYLDSSGSSFEFSISNNEIDFGKLNPGEPISRTNILTVTPAGAPGFQVTASENEELTADSGQVIPDTTCDTGACTETSADIWRTPLTYGFGYRCDSQTGACDRDFTTPDFYKQFANLAKKEENQIIMSQNGSSTSTSTVTYKVNIAATQPPGIYKSIIYYIATPSI